MDLQETIDVSLMDLIDAGWRRCYKIHIGIVMRSKGLKTLRQTVLIRKGHKGI